MVCLGRRAVMGGLAWVLGTAALADDAGPGVLAPPSAPTEPAPVVSAPRTGLAAPKPLRLSGLWRRERPDRSLECLEIFGDCRFTYRDSQGASCAGDLRADRGRLTLRARAGRRVLTYELTAAGLRLTAPREEDAGAVAGLAAMSPATNDSVLFGRLEDDGVGDLVETQSLAELAGEWVWGGDEHLTLTADGRYSYRGPAGLQSDGQVTWRAGELELRSPLVARTLVASLLLTRDGWALRLGALGGDRARPLDDLAELPPSLTPETLYRRPPSPVVSGALVGTWTCRDTSTPVVPRTVSLSLAADGTATLLVDGQSGGPVTGLRWSLQEHAFTLSLKDQRSIWRADLLAGDLLLARDDQAASGALALVPPQWESYARWRRK